MLRIKELRLERNLSVRKLAENVGLADTTVLRAEKGERKLSTQQAIKKYSAGTPTDAKESTKVLLSTFVDHIDISNERIVIYFKLELPGLPDSSAFDFVRKSTSVSTCVCLRTKYPISAIAALDVSCGVTSIILSRLLFVVRFCTPSG